MALIATEQQFHIHKTSFYDFIDIHINSIVEFLMCCLVAP